VELMTTRKLIGATLIATPFGLAIAAIIHKDGIVASVIYTVIVTTLFGFVWLGVKLINDDDKPRNSIPPIDPADPNTPRID